MSDTVLEVRRVSKTFGGTRALDDVDLRIEAGEIRGLLGQNGSGKSTLVKILSGFQDPDPGAIVEVCGADVAHAHSDAAARSLGFMHQDLGLDTSLPVVDNFLLGERRPALGPIRWRVERRRVAEALQRFGLVVDVSRNLEELTETERAIVALARALDRLDTARPGLLVLDEPTASLERAGVEMLFAAVDSLREHGCGVLFVTHHLQEVRRLCDTVSILRDGRLVADGPAGQFTEQDIVHAIVGKQLDEFYPQPLPPRHGDRVLSVRNLAGQSVRNISLDLHAGEILGITGLPGMGQDELPELIYGSRELTGGDVELFGAPHRPSPRSSLERGMVLLPADRKSMASDPASTVAENVVLPVAGRYFRRGRMDGSAEDRDVIDMLRRFDVRPPDPDRLLGQLSGGNQQKALLGKWLSFFGKARVVLLQEATQGVDIGARVEIFQAIRESAESGTTFLYVSTEHEDLAHICDRVLILRDGRISAELGRDELDEARIAALTLATAARTRSAPPRPVPRATPT